MFGIFKKRKARKANGMTKFKKAYKKYKQDGGKMSKEQFKQYYFAHLFPDKGKYNDSLESVLSGQLNEAPQIVKDVLSSLGVGNDEDDFDLNEDDDFDEFDLKEWSMSKTMGIPNFILALGGAYLLAKIFKIIK